VYINWLLSRKVQTSLVQALRVASRRLDVRPGDPEVAIDSNHLDQYVPHQYEHLLHLRQRSVELAQTFLR
jgi:hypothetical protein